MSQAVRSRHHIAYWILEKEAHTAPFKANLEHVTQVALEVSHTGGQLFLRVNKAEGRYLPSMFEPQKFEVWDDEIVFREAAGREVLDLGGNVKGLRLKRGLTQSALAKGINATASYISQVERNLISPSIDSLVLLSRELQAEPGYFFSGTGANSHRFISRKGQRQPVGLTNVERDSAKCQSLVASTDNRRMQPMLVTIEPDGELPGLPFDHRGDEFVLILRGELEVDIDAETHTLREGDSTYLDSAMPTAWRNLGEMPVQAVWVLSPPTSWSPQKK